MPRRPHDGCRHRGALSQPWSATGEKPTNAGQSLDPGGWHAGHTRPDHQKTFGPGIVADLPIQGLQLAFDVALNEATIPTGQITGSLKQADVQSFLLPALAALLNNILQSNPKSPLGQLFDTSGSMNLDGTVAQAGDGVIGVSELLTNPLISSLLAPDVQIWDATGENYAPNPLGGKTDSMSFGVGFSATAASY